MTTTAARTTITHPLDPLTADEITHAARIVRDAQPLGPRARFVTIELREPPKAAVLDGKSNAAIPREAFAIVLDRDSGRTHEAVVDLTAGALRSWTHKPDVQPYFLFEEFADAINAVRSNKEWQAAVRRHGIDDLDTVYVEPQPAGALGLPEHDGRRLMRVLAYRKPHKADYPWAQPLEGLVALLDVQSGEILHIVDEADGAPIPEETCRFDVDSVGPIRTGLKPLEITQPDGVSFEIVGHELRWQNWRMHIGMTPREGLVLHQIAYQENGRLRPVCYRASLAELVVPYAGTSAGQYWRAFFDSGEAAIGRFTNALDHGCDCLGEIVYLDAVLSDEQGEPKAYPNAVCIHEEDFGLLWKHADIFENTSEVRRSRRLVVSFIATVGNYDYAFYWFFYQDGSIEMEVRTTGVVLTQAIATGAAPETATVISRNLAAPNHQHLFCFRLDMDVDGPDNSVYEMSSEPVADRARNPYGNAFRSRAVQLTSERAAQRDIDPYSARYWKVVNASRRNGSGHAVGYTLIPGETTPMMASEDSSAGKRAAFGRHSLWVTPYDPDERYPAGDYPNQHPGGDGLPRWTQADRPLDDTDVVLWYTLGLTHIVRPEDWPIMPVHRAGFALRPWGFFDRNPALDVAPPDHCH